MGQKISLTKLFETPLQVKIIEKLLEKPSEYYTISKMARVVGASPAAVAKRIERLEKFKLVKMIEGAGKTKIFKFNEENELAIALLDFYTDFIRTDTPE